MSKNLSDNTKQTYNFLHREIEKDLQEKSYSRDICTRFPPEPNGYLHLGSAYAINISYTVAQKYDGSFNLRFDDTNPLKEKQEFVDAIIEDIKWAGFDPDRILYGSDYFDKIYNYAVQLIKKGKAYVCELNAEQMRIFRGTLTEPGKNSPYRDRSIEENLDLFTRMKEGEFEEGTKVLRAKIDMSSPNIIMRDPVIYRIIHASHYRTKDNWCIYPMYDFAHPLQDAIEGITHSMCSMEFKNNREVYNWFLEQLDFVEPPKQREFGRFNLTGVVTSKRYLRQLVAENHVDGWDDPRLPTLKGLRRRGFTPRSIHNFLGEVGIAKNQSTVDISMLENCLREDLKPKVNAVMAVLNPLKVVITNYPENQAEELEVQNNPNPELGVRKVPFSKEVYIEREDFMENPVKGFKRLMPGEEVRLKGAYFIRCNEVIKDENGEVLELHCTYDPETKSGTGFTARKPKGTIHWVSKNHGILADVHLYDRLLTDDELLKEEDKSWSDIINPKSFVKLQNCVIEPFLKEATCEDKFQFLRHGYFSVDTKYTTADKLVFNRIVPLKDPWKKGKKKKK
ncbi:glutamine--tRNA ligase/YqeY domain fusion protein [Proteinivorax hydrogeniformans]|uniref:Glutamine--tRNA ligase n=1 Tax=Proteinivorax hydrogeniformans TaxID=1826727 RepID=A0AAU8HSK8_9FIRM